MSQDSGPEGCPDGFNKTHRNHNSNEPKRFYFNFKKFYEVKSAWLPKDFLKCQTLAPKPTQEPRAKANPAQTRINLKKLGKAQKTKAGDWGLRLNLEFFTKEFFYQTINGLILVSECYLKLNQLNTSMSIIKSAEKILPLISDSLDPDLLKVSTKTYSYLAKIYLQFSLKFQTNHLSTSLNYYNKAFNHSIALYSLLTNSEIFPPNCTQHTLTECLKFLIVICLNMVICYQQSEDVPRLIETIKLIKFFLKNLLDDTVDMTVYSWGVVNVILDRYYCEGLGEFYEIENVILGARKEII
jgi:hypothetical protein